MNFISGNCDLQSQALEDLSDAVNYRRWLCGLAAPYLGDHPIEAGSGLGHYADEWLGQVERITVTEGEPSRLEALRARFEEEDRVEVRSLVLPTEHVGQHSAFVAFNVLEHIEQDVAALRSASHLVRPGGHVVLLVPAFEVAMSRFDRAVGHYRRYTVATMRDRLLAAGLEPLRVRYVNPVGLLAWIVMIKLMRGIPSNGPTLRAYDRFVVPVLRRIDARHEHGTGSPPFGQSVLAIARTTT